MAQGSDLHPNRIKQRRDQLLHGATGVIDARASRAKRRDPSRVFCPARPARRVCCCAQIMINPTACADHAPPDGAARRQPGQCLLQAPTCAGHLNVDKLKKRNSLQAFAASPALRNRQVRRRSSPVRVGNCQSPTAIRSGRSTSSCIRVARGSIYLVAMQDRFTRRVSAWKQRSHSRPAFAAKRLKQGWRNKAPAVFNTDQGSQFTPIGFIKVLAMRKITISMSLMTFPRNALTAIDGKSARCDNVFVECLWANP